jgi:hypothetical protein
LYVSASSISTAIAVQVRHLPEALLALGGR